MSFVPMWCLLRKDNILYCRGYPSKKAAKFNLKLKKGDPRFFIGIREVWN